MRALLFVYIIGEVAQWTGNRSNFTGPVTLLPGFVLGQMLSLDLWTD